ncbi:glycosyltransferase family 4 protein [Winogradskyella ludwigii]|uniref:glycosyltransferase family 4 protein n=1 Tax=Winogradskyella ludwigii TaxID=2686076 RepID=UPI0015CD2ED9|nr:glycosyltransferase family 4 protein [Winogradskyella ludwigii]
MKILIYTSVFYPSTGGMETVAEVLANEFSLLGHDVSVVTKTKLGSGKKKNNWAFPVYYDISFKKYWTLLHDADVILHNCISLKQVFPDWFYYRKVFVIHHTWYNKNVNGKLVLSSYLKRWVSRCVHNCFISKAIQDDLNIPGKVLSNPYDSELFKVNNNVHRTKELVFLGRLVSDKGGAILLEALLQLKPEFTPKLTIIGDGPEKLSLENYASKYLPGQVEFLGKLQGEKLALVLNEHQLMVVPSLWEEPFGVVALEGIGCGCLIIGSEGGGLKEAIGDCGWTFPNGNIDALAELLQKVLKKPQQWSQLQESMPLHLYKHQPSQIASDYLNYFKEHVKTT